MADTLGKNGSYGNDKFYQSYEWRTTRVNFMLQPENYFCRQCEKEGRQTKATVCDHIVNKRFVEDPFDVSNLQPLCHACHAEKSHGEANMVEPRKKKVFVIWGPPCSGKTTLVKEKKQPGDLVIDMDMIHHAITLKDLHERDQAIVPIAIATKRFLIDQARLANPAKRVWLIVSEPNENRVIEFCSTFDQVDLVAMKRVSKTEALRRLYSSNRKRKDKYEALIKNFYKQNPRWGRVGQISEG